ncbi:DUF881 domain-containing protein [Aeromicrobium sp.]|uniref:DUF881 domain-containing protein n=1 Tax=Aeromicrobium sp. TaxID=1871063 RepID=UPI003C591937
MVEQDAPTRAEGLLEQIAETALDDDYYVVRSGPYADSKEFNTVLTGAVLAMFAVMVSMAALQTRNDRPATELERNSLINSIAARKELVATRETTAAKLRAQVEALSTSVNSSDPVVKNLRILAADQPVRGPGVRFVAVPRDIGVDDDRVTEESRITDTDLQRLVNGLWYAGAEAIAINGQRIGSLSAIHSVDGVINVNYNDIGAPFTVLAIGDGESIVQRFTSNPAGRYWAEREKSAGVRLSMSPSSDLTVSATQRGRTAIRNAKAIKEKS